MRRLQMLAVLVLTGSLVGCTASREDAEKIIKDMNDALASFTTTLEGITDGASSKAANAKLKADADKIKALKEKADKTRVTKSTESSLEKQYQEELMKTGMRLGMAIQKVKNIPGTEAEIQIAMNMLNSLSAKD